MKNVTLLGSTGSIGRNSCEVLRRLRMDFRISGIAAGENLDLLGKQIEEFEPEVIAVKSEKGAAELRQRFPGKRIYAGPQGLLAVIGDPVPDCLIVAINGTDALAATLQAITAGTRICLANKETLVAAGDLINERLATSYAELIPVDSEQSAIFQCLGAAPFGRVKRIILTASGGPFFRDERDFRTITPREAMAHPVWSMGTKITIDSATLMNKALEVIEAHHLFGRPEEEIDVLIHPQSVIHSMVEFVDGSILAQLSVPDMKLPILYSLTYPERQETGMDRLDFEKLRQMEFYGVDENRFPSINLARQVLRTGKNAGAVFNTANEEAVAAFLAGRIDFPGIARLVEEILAITRFHPLHSLDDVLETIRETRIRTQEKLQGEIQK